MQPTNWEVPEKVTASHAWRRLAARTFDYIIYATIIGIILEYLSMGGNSFAKYYAAKFLELFLLPNISMFEGYIVDILLVTISILINSIFIYCFGNTLGKKIFGIKIVHINNLPYNFITLFRRETLVITRGFGYLLPLLNELIYYLSYKRLISTNSTIWDTQLNFKIIYQPRKLWVIIITISPVILFMCFEYWLFYSEIFNFSSQ